MRTAEGILEDYRQGDLHRRLNLYLQYRDLRSRFTEIDFEERDSPQRGLREVLENTDRYRTMRYRIGKYFSQG